MIQRSIVIVGAGPAGMSAAIALAENGLRPTIIDENADIGGQIYRQPPATLRAPPSKPAARSDDGVDLMRRFQDLAHKIELFKNTKVWGVFDSRRLAVTTPDGWQMVEAERVVLAPGAYEFVPPFPGWTLPGVMTPGGAQLIAKTMNILPGSRALVVGTGPFLLVVANNLHDAGMKVVGVVECIRTAETIKSLPALLRNPGMVRQGWQYLRRLRRARIPMHAGHVIVDAQGQDQVERVRFAGCDHDWRPDRSRVKSVDVDTLCVGYGFVPRTELAQLAGCRMRWVDEWGGWIPHVNENLETSVRGVWVAGDGGGVAGATVAQHEGRLAGLAVARDSDALDEDSFQQLRRPVLRQLNKLRRFRQTLDALSQIRPGLSQLADRDTVVCRCEELTRGEVDAAIDFGSTTYRTLKVATRLGMGQCQGRMCWPAMARYVAMKTGQPIEQTGALSVRPPTVPVTLGDLARAQCAETIVSGGDTP